VHAGTVRAVRSRVMRSSDRNNAGRLCRSFMDREHLGSQSHHGIIGDLHSAQLTSPSETYLHEGSLPSKTALIREKTALLFREYFILVLIWLSGSEPTQKITANSTYWKAKLRGAGGVTRSRGKEHLFLRQRSGNSSSATDVNFILDTRISKINQSLRTVGDHLFRPDHFSDGEPLSRNHSGLTFS
jgi:hypothetical protein